MGAPTEGREQATTAGVSGCGRRVRGVSRHPAPHGAGGMERGGGRGWARREGVSVGGGGARADGQPGEADDAAGLAGGEVEEVLRGSWRTGRRTGGQAETLTRQRRCGGVGWKQQSGGCRFCLYIDERDRQHGASRGEVWAGRGRRRGAAQRQEERGRRRGKSGGGLSPRVVPCGTAVGASPLPEENTGRRGR